MRADREHQLHHHRNNTLSTEVMIKAGRMQILRPSCVGGACSGIGAVTMKISDYGVP
jgi:hypothetical protein